MSGKGEADDAKAATLLRIANALLALERATVEVVARLDVIERQQSVILRLEDRLLRFEERLSRLEERLPAKKRKRKHV